MSVLLYDPIKTMSALTDEVLVAFSGGKDSIVALDLCCKYFKRVVPFFCYTVPHLSFQENQMNWYEKRYNIKIHRIPDPVVSRMLHYGIYCNYDFTVPITSHADNYNYMRAITGIKWIVTGERISDSIVRGAMIKHSSTIDETRGCFYPVAEWKKKQILEYIKKAKLKLGEDSKKLGYSLYGISGEEIKTLHDVFPEDYAREEQFYPLIGVKWKRFEAYGKQ